MESRSLGKLIRFSLGKNPTRLKEQGAELYTAEDFERDLHVVNISDGSKNCIINMIKSKASPLSVQTAGKCITSNFLKCEFDTDILDPWYFCYQFNEGKNFEQQIAMYHQGTTLCVKKLNVKIIRELKIRLPDIKKQRIIGELYKKSIVQHDLMMKQASDMKKLTMEIINKIEED